MTAQPSRRRGRPPHPDILTPREWQVLALLRDGLTNEQIAQRLDISFATAKYHVAEIISKLGVQTREEAAAWQPPAAPVRAWWLRVSSPVGLALRHLEPLTPAKAAIAAGSLAALAGLAIAGALLFSRGDGGVAETASDPTIQAVRRFQARSVQEPAPSSSGTPEQPFVPPPSSATPTPVQGTPQLVSNDTPLRAEFPIPNSDGIRLIGGLYMVAPDGSGLAALALPDDPAAGADLAFSTHSVSPDGRWLAYSPGPPRGTPPTPPGQTVYLKDLFGSQSATPVTDFARIWSLDVSPGGKKIIVNGTLNPATPGPGPGQHYLVDVDTGSSQELPAFNSAYSVDWSPTGERIAALFASTLKFFAPDGTELLSLDLPFGQVAWSRDGTRLALAATTGIYIIETNGSVHHVSDVPTSQWPGGISWSPEDNRIALTSYGSDRQNMVGVLDVTTGQRTPLVAGESPAWSRNGTGITYVDEGRLRRVDAQTGETSELVSAAQPLVASPQPMADDAGVVFHYAPRFLRSIRTANTDGSDEHHIAYGEGPAWSPDGSRIAFLGRAVSFGLSGFNEVYVMNRDGTDPRKVAVVYSTDALICQTATPGLSWSDDGTRVLYYDQARNGIFSAPANGDGAAELVSGGCPPSTSSSPTPDVIPSPTGDLVIIVR